MTTIETTDPTAEALLDELRGTRDALSVRRVFGDPHTIDGVTIVPVARVAGGAGGGGGEGTGPGVEGGHGFGTGFGLSARGLGVYEIRDGDLTWRPAIDADRLIRGGVIIASISIACATLTRLRHHSRTLGVFDSDRRRRGWRRRSR